MGTVVDLKTGQILPTPLGGAASLATPATLPALTIDVENILEYLQTLAAGDKINALMVAVIHNNGTPHQGLCRRR